MMECGKLDTVGDKNTAGSLQPTGGGYLLNEVLVGGDNWIFLSSSRPDLVLHWKLLFASGVTKSLLLLDVSQVQAKCLLQSILVVGSDPTFASI